MRTFTGGFVAATEDGILNFYKQLPEPNDKPSNNKYPRFEFVKKWTCDSLRNYKIVSLAVYEINKDSEIFLAIATKNQNIVYLNVMRQFYTSQNAKTDIYGNPLNPDEDYLPTDEI